MLASLLDSNWLSELRWDLFSFNASGCQSFVNPLPSNVCIPTGFWLFAKENPEIEIDTIYRIEHQDQLYKTLPQALFFSPTIVVFLALTLLLPLSGVFAPGSLTITTKNSTNVGDCMIPIGNVSTHKYDSNSFFNMYSNLTYIDPAPRAKVLTTRWLVEQNIPDLEVFTLPRLIHMESMDSTPPFHGFHMEWFWVRSQLFFGSMVTLDSIWNGHGMAMEW